MSAYPELPPKEAETVSMPEFTFRQYASRAARNLKLIPWLDATLANTWAKMVAEPGDHKGYDINYYRAGSFYHVIRLVDQPDECAAICELLNRHDEGVRKLIEPCRAVRGAKKTIQDMYNEGGSFHVERAALGPK